jgi:hypothetical protein
MARMVLDAVIINLLKRGCAKIARANDVAVQGGAPHPQGRNALEHPACRVADAAAATCPRDTRFSHIPISGDCRLAAHHPLGGFSCAAPFDAHTRHTTDGTRQRAALPHGIAPEGGNTGCSVRSRTASISGYGETPDSGGKPTHGPRSGGTRVPPRSRRRGVGRGEAASRGPGTQRNCRLRQFRLSSWAEAASGERRGKASRPPLRRVRADMTCASDVSADAARRLMAARLPLSSAGRLQPHGRLRKLRSGPRRGCARTTRRPMVSEPVFRPIRCHCRNRQRYKAPPPGSRWEAPACEERRRRSVWPLSRTSPCLHARKW